MKKFVSNKDESPQLFKNKQLETLTKVHPVTPLIVFVPVVIYSFIVQMKTISSWSLAFEVLASGFLVWTLFEYLLHRFIFHWEPENKIGKYMHFLFHGIHHDYPRDSKRLVMPPTVGIIAAALLYFLFGRIMPHYWLNGFFSGFMIGYLCYDMAHFAIHHFNFKSRWFIELRNNHFMHHYNDHTSNFGVSSPLWDYILMTVHKKQQKVNQES